MTPAVKLLDKLKITYQLHQYHHDESAASYGLEAAEKLAVPAERVFKTLVVSLNTKEYAVYKNAYDKLIDSYLSVIVATKTFNEATPLEQKELIERSRSIESMVELILL